MAWSTKGTSTTADRTYASLRSCSESCARSTTSIRSATFCRPRSSSRLLRWARPNWPALAGVFCRVRPAGHLLPVRAQFGGLGGKPGNGGSASFQIALTPVDSDGRDLWYALADLVACRLLTGNAPEVLEALRIAPG